MEPAGGPSATSDPVAPSPGRVARARAWSQLRARQASVWIHEARGGHASVDVGFRLLDRDKRVAAGVLAGGVAYRFFFWLLALFALLVGGLGLGDGHRLEQALHDSGVDPKLAQAALDSWQTSQQARWWLLVTGAWLMLWTGYLVAKSLVLVHAVVWGMVPPPVRNRLRASVGFTGAAAVFIAAVVLCRWLRTLSPGFGLVASLLVVVVPFAMWIAASQVLPHASTSWRDLVPGAALFALGVQALHLFTVFYLSQKLQHATEVNGLMGIVGTILFCLFIAGRLVVGSATLNASLWEHRSRSVEDASTRERERRAI